MRSSAVVSPGVKLVLALSLTMMVGCGTGGAKSTAGPGGVKRYAASDLPKVDYGLPPLDGDRIDVPFPARWAPTSQKKGFVVVLQLKGRSGFPQMIMTVEPVAGGDVTADSVSAYAAEVQTGLDAQVAANQTKQLEKAKPLILGENAFARYVLAGRRPGREVATIERQVLTTVRGGRKYVLELQVTGELMEFRDDAYAVAAGIKFLSAGAKNGETEDVPATPERGAEEPVDAQKPPAEKPATEKPAAEKPPADKPAEEPPK